MQYLKSYKLFENAEFSIDRSEIGKICKRLGFEKYVINPDGSVGIDADIDEKIRMMCDIIVEGNYSINTDGTVDVDGNVDLGGYDSTKLPLKFGKVSGNFDCSNSKLDFRIWGGAPKEVGGDFNCSGMAWKPSTLTSLEGSPEEVGGDFTCSTNRLTSLIGAPKKVGGDFYCSENKIYDFPFENGEFCWQGNIYFKCIDNARVGHVVSLGDGSNPIQEIFALFESKEKFFQSLDYHYFKGGDRLDKRRFYQALEEQNITPPTKLTNYILE